MSVGGARPLEGIRVTVVDDDGDTLDIECLILQVAGAETDCVVDAASALRSMEAVPPAVLIADLAMPSRDGLSFIRQLRAHPQEPLRSLPAIALSAHASETARREALGAGFDLFLAKPVYPADLVDAVVSVIRKRGA